MQLGGKESVWRDGADGAPVVILNESMARAHFGDSDPIGTASNGSIRGTVTDNTGAAVAGRVKVRAGPSGCKVDPWPSDASTC